MWNSIWRGVVLALITSGWAIAAEPVPIHNWAGCYVGGYVGAGWGGQVLGVDPRSTGGAFPAGSFYNAPYANAENNGLYIYDLTDSGAGGGTIGCNLQFRGWVVGLEGEGGYMLLRQRSVDPHSYLKGFDTSDSTRIGSWYAVAAGRLGWATDHALLYVKGGVGFTEVQSSISDTCNTGACGPGLLSATASSNRAFWVAGGGIEWAWTANWSVKAEYLILGLRETANLCGAGAAAAAGSTFCAWRRIDDVHTAKIGINYRFVGPGGDITRTGQTAPRTRLFDADRFELRGGFFEHGWGSPERSTNDLNLELVTPRLWTGIPAWWSALIPRLQVGGLVNLQGRTNVAYTGALWSVPVTERWFVEGFVGGAIHDNKHLNDFTWFDAQLGCRELFNSGGSVGYIPTAGWSVLFTFQHFSNGNRLFGTSCQKNNGLNNYGVKLGYSF